MFVNVRMFGLLFVSSILLLATNPQKGISQTPDTEPLLAPVMVRVSFWSPEIPRSVSVDFYKVSIVNGKWKRGSYITSLSTRKNGQQNDQVIRGYRFLDGNKYWVQLNYTTVSGQRRVYCLINRGNETVWFRAGSPNTSIQP